MAANYWASTQSRYWQFSRETLTKIRQQLEDEDHNLVQQYPLPDRRLLSKFFNERVSVPDLRLDSLKGILTDFKQS